MSDIDTDEDYDEGDVYCDGYQCPLCLENMPKNNKARHESFECKVLIENNELDFLSHGSTKDVSSDKYQCPLCLEKMDKTKKTYHESFECTVLIEGNGIDDPADAFREEPCQFCGESFPSVLLREHEATHSELEDVTAPLGNYLGNILKSETVDFKNLLELNQGSSHPAQPPKTVEQTTENKATEQPKLFEEVTAQPPKVANQATESKVTKPNPFQKYHTSVEESTMKKGEKLFVYGADIDPKEEMESEELSYKMPNLSLNDTPKEEDVEDINNLSDDNCDESLEEFWRRATDFLKRNRGKIRY